MAASANLPVIVFSLFWRRFNTTGAVVGIGHRACCASIILILLSPTLRRHEGAIFPLTNPGILSIPLGFLGAIVGTMLSKRTARRGRSSPS